MPFGLRPMHLVVIVIVALVIFGPKRLPQIGRWIGRAFMEFRRGAREMTNGFKDEMEKTAAEDSRAASRETTQAATTPGGTGHGAAVHGGPVPDAATSIANDSSAAESDAPAATPYPEAAGNYCIKCGAANAQDALYCNKCGSKLPA